MELFQMGRYHDRALAGLLVVLSALAIRDFGYAMDVIVIRHYESLSRNEIQLPQITDVFFSYFGHRPGGNFMQVITWFWWPMLWAFIFCLVANPHNPSHFLPRFLAWFLVSWLTLVAFLSFCLWVLSLPYVTLLASLQPPPHAAQVIPLVSMMLPITTGLIAVCMLFAFSHRWVRNRGRIGNQNTE